jgi:predicted DNA-binding transcriptional regulator YafY
MLETSVRLLRLLSLLQQRREWSGADLASRLEVTTRTVRNDVDKLRQLGYQVDSTTGPAGGYRLGSGSAMPPLLLDDDEAVAVVVGLRAAAAGTVTGIEDVSLRALTKLERTLPSRLRPRVDALRTATVSAAGGGPRVDMETLSTVAAAAHNNERLRFEYASHDGTVSERDVEPHTLVYTGRRWYLLAWDTDRRDWRTFRTGSRCRRAATRQSLPARGSSRASHPAATRPRTCCAERCRRRGRTRCASSCGRRRPSWPSAPRRPRAG